MPGVSANAEAIPEFPQPPRHIRKCLISSNACDIYIKKHLLLDQFILEDKFTYKTKKLF
jgi:hypothetical protein